MNLDDLIARINNFEDRFESINKSLMAINKRISEIDNKTTGFLELARDDKKEIARLNSIVMGLGQFDSAITQVRVDFNRKLDDFQNQTKQEAQLKANLIEEDFRSINAAIEKIKRELSLEFDKKLGLFLEENNRLLNRFKGVETEVRDRLTSTNELITTVNTIDQDLRRINKQVENLQNENGASKGTMDEIRSKLEVISNSLRTNESRLNEMIVTDSDRRQVQLDFIGKQTLIQKDRERIWGEWEQQFGEVLGQVSEMLPEMQNQQIALRHSKERFDEISQQFDRRINELTEMHRLMDEKIKKEWATFKSDSEKRWANISLVLDDKQGGYSGQVQLLKERLVLVEDNTHEMQEVLLLMR